MNKYFFRKIKNVLQCSVVQKIFLHYMKVDFIKQVSILDISSMFDFMKKSGSIVRFGDGEIQILEHKGAPDYQKYSDELRERLHQVFVANNSNLLVCVPECICEGYDFKTMTTGAAYFWAKFIWLHNEWLQTNIEKGKKYGDANISRPWIDFQNEVRAKHIFQQFKNLFADRDILIIEGEYTKFGVGNDLLGKAKSIKRILGPATNAYSCCDLLVSTAASLSKDMLVIVSLGPAGKIVTYELVKRGFQVWDLGHLDIEYEWYLRKSTKKESILGKYVNEASEKLLEKNKLDAFSYRKQVIARITFKKHSV